LVGAALGFQQAAIKVQKEKEFGELNAALGRIFAAENVERFLKKLQGKGIRIRDFDLVLASGVFEELDDALAKPGNDGRKLYQELTTSDQAQIREFYLSKIEEVETGLRTKYQKLYRYY
jgi:hypothetical protein